jgi:glycosyltransferase involved in cell wall biosynthesis
MEKIRVKPIFGAHQIYQEIVNFPSEGVEYIGISKETSKGDYYKRKRIKEKIGALLKKLKLPRMTFVRPGDYDIIHSSRGIIPITTKPWVMDIEHVHSFFSLNPDFLRSRFWKRFIEKRLEANNCKAILCHCEATRQAFFEYLDCTRFKDKIHVLYPSSHLINFKREKSNKIRFLSVLSLFYHKGGPQILKAFSELEKRYKNIELVIKADVPEEFKKRFNSKNIMYINFFDNIIPREELIKKYYKEADIFLYPTFCDSFGYSFIDAMVAKLPVITTNLFACPEIVSDGVNGFVVDIPGYKLKPEFIQNSDWKKIKGKKEKVFVDILLDRMERLILDEKLRKKMGNNNFELISLGRFSIKERNNKLKEIYKKALM